MKYINQACSFDEFNSKDWIFYVKNKPVTVTECKNSCYNNIHCTGFEISQYGTPNSHIVLYGIIWLVMYQINIFMI